ncbi:MAG: DUF370 domain-containing protein [Clostridiales bacterium]|jgi:hypothetical protein|nr:DUF370 domain-containing protein [Clostridiales bacterium]HOA33070.1 DUF370 domain-containing protein [Clostridiales bacterium]HOJ35116.1 DUF370 domain-containing protein [Clostridiales bacterium]HOL79203.1 DUF370 domain-containing protein [Clostridiales bacterium]HPP67957.1 DUF370 domain-containing protein [Clostridiales bacterium]
MFLHLGQSTVVTMDEIIGIFDLERTTVSKRTRDFLAHAEREGKVINVSYELPRSFIITKREGEEEKIYISQLSSATLLKRSEQERIG